MKEDPSIHPPVLLLKKKKIFLPPAQYMYYWMDLFQHDSTQYYCDIRTYVYVIIRTTAPTNEEPSY